MHKFFSSVLYWAPRILGILAALFITLFAMDSEGFAMLALHLIPTCVLVAALLVAWRWSTLGTLVYILVGFVAMARYNGSLALGGIPMIIGLLFYFSPEKARPKKMHPEQAGELIES